MKVLLTVMMYVAAGAGGIFTASFLLAVFFHWRSLTRPRLERRLAGTYKGAAAVRAGVGKVES